MNEFCISHRKSKTAQVAGVLIGGYLTIFCLYFVVTAILAKQYDILFYCSLVGAVFAAFILLKNTLLQAKPLVKIDNNELEVNLSTQKSALIDWADVSQVSVGISYLVFMLNGKKQQKFDLSTLTYDEMKSTKSKVVEICEHKSIPYKND